MLQDGKTLKVPAQTDFEALMAQLAVLRHDIAKLTGSVAALAERRGRRMATDMTEGVSEALHYVERKGSGAEAELEKSVATHPLMALAIAAGIGLLIGAVMRRG